MIASTFLATEYTRMILEVIFDYKSDKTVNFYKTKFLYLMSRKNIEWTLTKV